MDRLNSCESLSIRKITIEPCLIFTRCLLLLMLLLNLQTPSAAQFHSDKTSFQLKPVIAENILQESAINKMVEDQNGFIWLGTISGLIRFDGYEFHHYSKIPGDSTSLSDNFVKSLYLDRSQRLWAGTFGGLNLYDPVHDNFIRFPPGITEGTLTDGFINDITEDEDGAIWLATYNGLNKFVPDKRIFEAFYPVDSGQNIVKDITAVQFVRDTLWIGTQGRGMYFMTDNKIQAYPSVPYGYRIYDIYKRNDLFLLSTETGLVSITSKDKVDFFHKNIFFHDIIELKNGRVLLCTHQNGLFEWDPGTHHPYICNLHINSGISVDRNIGVYSILEDSSQNIWFCYDGLKKISPVSGMFKTFTPPRAHPFRRSDEVILSILPANKNEIYAVTAGGAIHRFDYHTNTFTRSITSQTIRSGQIQGVFTDRHNRLWGFNKQNELGLVQDKNFVVKKRLNGINGISTPLVAKSMNNRIYIGSPSGLIAGDLDEEYSYSLFQEAPEYPDSLANNTISALLIQNEDSVWVAGGSVLHLYLPTEKRFVRFGEIRGHDHFIQAIDLDTKGNVWIARNNGLAYWNKETGELQEVHEMTLGSTNFVSISADTQDRIWAGTTAGIVCYDPATRRFNKFNSPYGAQNYYYRFSSAKTSDGHLIFGGLNGFTLFHPDDILADITRPRVIITQIDDGEKSLELNEAIYQTSSIGLSDKYKILNFGFVGIYYNDPQGLTYSYYLEGVDKYWHHSGSRRYVSYSNLPRGERLTFYLKATSPSGIESPVRKLSIFIKPHFWETQWFVGFISIFLMLTVGIVYRMRVAGLKRRQSELRKQVEAATLEIKQQSKKIHEMDDLKIKFYTNISHEFRTPLTLIAGPVGNLIKHNNTMRGTDRLKSLRLIERNTERLLRLINQLLDLNKLDEGAFTLHYSKTDLTGQAKRIYEVFVPLADKHAIDFKFKSPGRIERSIDPDVYEKILYNLLSNAFKFTPDGKAIELVIGELGKDYVQVRVSDTGLGIDGVHLKNIFERFNQGELSAVKSGTGIGLTYVKKLAELHGGKVHVESREHTGSTFTVTFKTAPDEETSASTALTEIAKNKGLSPRPEEYRSNRGIQYEYQTGNKAKILVIDDNEDVREFMYSFLCPAYSIIEARDGREGFALAISSVPEIIVSDIMMPSPDGLELCHLLKTNEITSHIPVILLTAKAADYHKAEGYKNGADSYITKPFTGETLLARIGNLIEGRKKLRNFYFKHAFLEQDEAGRPNPESEFLRKCSRFVCNNLDNSELDIAVFCKYMGMSQTQLYRKLLAITGMPISDFIQSYRLKQASLLLQSGKYTVSEIAYRVGFNDPSYFTKCFSKHFGFTPSKYLKGTVTSSTR